MPSCFCTVHHFWRNYLHIYRLHGFMLSVTNYLKKETGLSRPWFRIFINQPVSQAVTSEERVFIHILLKFFSNWLHLYVRDKLYPSQQQPPQCSYNCSFFPHFISNLPLIDFSVCLSSSSLPPDLLWYDTNVQYFSVCSFFQTVVSGKRYVLL